MPLNSGLPLAGFADIYIPTLATVGTLIALLTVYFARKDRGGERAADQKRRRQEALGRAMDAVVALLEAASSLSTEPAQVDIAWNQDAITADPLTQGEAAYLAARLRLRAALVQTRLGSRCLPVSHALANAPVPIVRDGATNAITELAGMIDRIERDVCRRDRQEPGTGPYEPEEDER